MPKEHKNLARVNTLSGGFFRWDGNMLCFTGYNLNDLTLLY